MAASLRDERRERRLQNAPQPTTNGSRVNEGWAIGLTTVYSRYCTSLPETLNSLRLAGFPLAHIFLDGRTNSQYGEYKHTVRDYSLGAFGNWICALWELYVSNPFAAKYAMFQDDFICCRNLFPFLDVQVLPDDQYWNLYTWNHNARDATGWHLSDQMGKGAVALVFPNAFVRQLLNHVHMVEKPRQEKRSNSSIDGAVVEVAKQIGVKEVCHSPSLTQHTGKISSIGNHEHPQCRTFPGERFNALDILEQGNYTLREE